MANLPGFMDQWMFQVPMQYCSLQHQTLLSPPDTSTNELCFRFGPAFSLFLELLVIALCSSPVVYWTPAWGAHLPKWWVSYLFALSYYSRDSGGKNTGVICHSLLQWTMFGQNSPQWPVHLRWPWMAWLIVSLGYASPLAMTLNHCLLEKYKLWRRQWQPTPVFLPGESHGQRSLAGPLGSQRVKHNLATGMHTHPLGPTCAVWLISLKMLDVVIG